MRPVWVKISGGTPARSRVRFPPVGRSTETVMRTRTHGSIRSTPRGFRRGRAASRLLVSDPVRGVAATWNSSGHALRSLYNPNCEAFAAFKEFLNGSSPDVAST